MTVHEQIVAAREYMATHGMVKGILWNDRGEVCIQGAFDRVLGFDGAHFMHRHTATTLYTLMTVEECRRAVGQCSRVCAPRLDPRKGHWGWLAHFNNHPDTTRDEVLALYDRAIAATAAPAEVVEERELALA